MSKVTVATSWLDGCSGCHMSFLDIDQRLLDLADQIDIVYSPLVDNKEFPKSVDVTILEGAIASDEDLEKVRMIRGRTKILVSIGDCSITGNVPSMRNTCTMNDIYDRAYKENVTANPQYPDKHLPQLLKRVCPVHEAVKVDVFIPGCPPPANAIFFVISELLAGRVPDPSALTRFGK